MWNVAARRQYDQWLFSFPPSFPYFSFYVNHSVITLWEEVMFPFLELFLSKECISNHINEQGSCYRSFSIQQACVIREFGANEHALCKDEN
jgi:hypothetical protein